MGWFVSRQSSVCVTTVHQPQGIKRMTEQQDPRGPAPEKHATLEQRRQIWIDMRFDAFLELCLKQKLLSPGVGVEILTNECYNEALDLYTKVHYPKFWPDDIVSCYLDLLEELRGAQNSVSADTFLRTRQLDFAHDLPARPSLLTDFLLFNKGFSIYDGSSKIHDLCRGCHDSALDGDSAVSAECASLAFRFIFEMESTLSDETFGQELQTKAKMFSSIYQHSRESLWLNYDEADDEGKRWRASSLRYMKTDLEPLIAAMHSTSQTKDSQKTQRSGFSGL